MTPSRIFLSSPHMGGLENRYVEEALRLNHVFPLGTHVTGLEQDICRYTGIGHATCLSSGTAAIHLALLMLGVGREDEVLCSSFTFAASANPICYCGATPVFVDSEVHTWNMHPGLLEAAIVGRMKATGKKPSAIILVHLYGMPANLDAIMAISAAYDIPIIEDAAEALGSTYQDRHCGTFGAIGIYSFNGNKIITTSGGGALVSHNEDYCKRALFLATQARDAAPHYEHSTVGYNYRMSNIAAGIGRGQMEVLAERISVRRLHFNHYQEQLQHIPGISFLAEPEEHYFSNHWLTTLLLPSDGLTSAEVVNAMEAENIECRPLWKPMHLQPVFEAYPAYTDGTSEGLFRRGLCLPSSSNMTAVERQRVIDTLIQVLGR